jgi:hypothetical protein
MQFAKRDRAADYRRIADLTRVRADKVLDRRARSAMLEAAGIWDRWAKIEDNRCDRLLDLGAI